MITSIEEFEAELERREQLEYRDVLLAVQSLMTTSDGVKVFSYLMKNLNVTKLPEQGMEGVELHDYLGFLRAGNSVYKLLCQADPEEAAKLIAKIERKEHDDRNERYAIENAITTNE